MHSFNKKTSYLYMEIKFLDEIKLKIIFIIIKCCFKFILFIYLFIYFSFKFNAYKKNIFTWPLI